jgi:hypothetical protein
VRPLRITKKRIVVSTPALEEFLTGFTEDLVDAIENRLEFAYEQKAAADPDWESNGEYNDNDHIGNALVDIGMDLDTLRDLVSHVPQGGYASQVLIGNRAGTLTIVRGNPTFGEPNRMRRSPRHRIGRSET